MSTAVIYARVSTEEQAEKGRSIKDQITSCKALASKNGYKNFVVFTDPGKSGSLPWDKRPGLKDAMIRCEQGDVDAFYILDTDRLARNVTQHMAIRTNLQRLSIQLVSLNQPMLSDNTPESGLIEIVTAAVNAYIPQVTGRKVSLSMEKKVEEGWWPGWAPLGYKNVNKGTNDNPKRIVVPDKKTAPLITKAFEDYSTGMYSLEQLAEKYNQLGLRTKTGRELNKQRVSEILGNTFYTGVIFFKGKIYPGKHKPLISDRLYRLVQEYIGHRNHHADRSHKHFLHLRGHVYCGLRGKPLTASVNAPRNKVYYHCPIQESQHSNKGQNIEKEELEKQIERLFKKIQLPSSFVDKVIDIARSVLKETHQNKDGEKRLLQEQQTRLEHNRNTLELKMLEGIVDDRTYVRQHGLLEEKIDALQKQIHQLSDDRGDNIKAVEDLLRLARNIYGAYREADPRRKKKLLNTFWKRIEVKDRQIMSAEPTEQFKALTGIKILENTGTEHNLCQSKISENHGITKAKIPENPCIPTDRNWPKKAENGGTEQNLTNLTPKKENRLDKFDTKKEPELVPISTSNRGNVITSRKWLPLVDEFRTKSQAINRLAQLLPNLQIQGGMV